ncbi:hypothetical protein LEP1GSC062_4087 [Leptospira alexanderi serovar Manhao 3 str. L 60]|uniref:Uncharacterized protein n=1 Tax=Leptospira alexanderi serovar Manhao 3 str. L 60 TaxID=1049759 RepID=V6I5B7_9LEPT|nr:hypothetical protein LEP1GSC062_4087 [Leptospira alexanderi serovar Manhao 3 str. L 60]
MSSSQWFLERKFSTRKILSLEFEFYLFLKILRICPKIPIVGVLGVSG